MHQRKEAGGQLRGARAAAEAVVGQQRVQQRLEEGRWAQAPDRGSIFVMGRWATFELGACVSASEHVCVMCLPH